MWIPQIITFLLLIFISWYVYKTKKGLLALTWTLTIFVSLFIIEQPYIESIRLSRDKLEIIKEAKKINEETKDVAVKTANLVALMASYTGWGNQGIPRTKDRLYFYKSVLERASELMRNAGINPNNFQNIKELKGVIKTFKEGEELITRPSSEELQSLADK